MLLASPDECCVQVVASSLDTLEPVLLEGFESKEDLVACLKASANVPRIAGEPLQHRYHHPEKKRLHLLASITTIHQHVVACMVVLGTAVSAPLGP